MDGLRLVKYCMLRTANVLQAGGALFGRQVQECSPKAIGRAQIPAHVPRTEARLVRSPGLIRSGAVERPACRRSPWRGRAWRGAGRMIAPDPLQHPKIKMPQVPAVFLMAPSISRALDTRRPMAIMLGDSFHFSFPSQENPHGRYMDPKLFLD